MSVPFTLLDLLALGYFFLAWVSYAYFAKRRACHPETVSLSRTLRRHRENWVDEFLKRDMRMADASLLANQERVVGVFASTTMLLLAAVFTALANSDLIAKIASEIPFAQSQTKAEVELKLLVLGMILTFAFFKISWSLRQYGFVSVLMGSAPSHEQPLTASQRQAYIKNLGKLMDLAGHDNNSGLRAYYFAIALLSWQLGTLPFVVVTTLILVVLYKREFKSAAVMAMEKASISQGLE